MAGKLRVPPTVSLFRSAEGGLLFLDAPHAQSPRGAPGVVVEAKAVAAVGSSQPIALGNRGSTGCMAGQYLKSDFVGLFYLYPFPPCFTVAEGVFWTLTCAKLVGGTWSSD